MGRDFDLFQYFTYLKSRWRFAALACAVSLALAGAISLLQSPKYTSTARIIIDPPAGSDVRSDVVMSPIYMESLRTYLLFASSDTVFREAALRFGLLNARARSLSALKKAVLKVELPRDTKVLEIAASLPDPVKAQAFASYMAQRIVALNERVRGEADQALVSASEKQARDAKAHLDQAEAAYARLASAAPVDTLKQETASMEGLRAKLRADAANAELQIADNLDREKALAESSDSGQLAEVRRELRSFRLTFEGLNRQVRELDSGIAARQMLLDRNIAARDELMGQCKAARTVYEAAETRLAETRATVGYRGERLRVIDPGVVPDRPSSPDPFLNLSVALIAALALTLLIATLEFNYRAQRNVERLRPLRIAGNE